MNTIDESLNVALGLVRAMGGESKPLDGVTSAVSLEGHTSSQKSNAEMFLDDGFSALFEIRNASPEHSVQVETAARSFVALALALVMDKLEIINQKSEEYLQRERQEFEERLKTEVIFAAVHKIVAGDSEKQLSSKTLAVELEKHLKAEGTANYFLPESISRVRAKIKPVVPEYASTPGLRKIKTRLSDGE